MISMKNGQSKFILIFVVLTTLLPVSLAFGQRGVGDYYGVGQLPVKPSLVLLSGELKEITNHPCENTTGPAVIGTHLILENDKGERLNIHLGPTSLVADNLKFLSVGEKLDVIAFRTDRLPANQYIAKILIVGGQLIQLRDNYLRPYWSGFGGGSSTFPPSTWTSQPSEDYSFGYRPWVRRGYGRGWRRFDSGMNFRGRGFEGGRGCCRCWPVAYFKQ